MGNSQRAKEGFASDFVCRKHLKIPLPLFTHSLIGSLALCLFLLSFDRMNSALHKKLRIGENLSVGLVSEPEGFDDAMFPLPPGTKISKSFSSKNDVIFWFVKTKVELEKSLHDVLAALSETSIIWIGYPKGTSGIQTDLSRDKGWDSIKAIPDICFVSFISFDDTWSVFCIRKKNEADFKREQKKVTREIFEYANSKTKNITLPDDLQKILNKNKKAKSIFAALAFSHKREYVEWIITARRDETRKARLQGTIDKLNTGYKNPAGR